MCLTAFWYQFLHKKKYSELYHLYAQYDLALSALFVIFFNTTQWIKFHHHHHISFMELSHLLTHSGLTYPEVSSKVYHDSFCQFGSSISLPWVIYFEAFIYVLYVMCNTIACPTQQSSSPSRGIPCSHKWGNDAQVTPV